jgi:hypothetical protein
MKKLLFLFLLIPNLMFSQTKEQIDSVNYYFGILLRQDRDSVNQYRIENGMKQLNTVEIETNRKLFVNPDEHIDYCIRKCHNAEVFYPHKGIYRENFYAETSMEDDSKEYQDPQKVATLLYDSWKHSPKGHFYLMMSDPNFSEGFDYETFIVRYKFSFKENVKCPWLMIATFTVYTSEDRK